MLEVEQTAEISRTVETEQLTGRVGRIPEGCLSCVNAARVAIPYHQRDSAERHPVETSVDLRGEDKALT